MGNRGTTTTPTPAPARTPRVVAALALALLIAACSDASANGSSSPTSASPTTSSASSSSPAPVTTTTAVPITTTPPTSTSPASSAPPTTEEEPTTTTNPIVAAVRQGVHDYIAASTTCSVDPATCDAAAFTVEGSPARSNAVAYYAQLVKLGFHASPADRGSYIVIESVTFNSNNEAAVMICGYDAGIMLGLPGPDGQPTVVNDQLVSARSTLTMDLREGRWLVGKSESARLGEGNLCPPQG